MANVLITGWLGETLVLPSFHVKVYLGCVSFSSVPFGQAVSHLPVVRIRAVCALSSDWENI
jgi:hypothetical protein